MRKEDATHRIDLEVKFDPLLINKEEIENIIFRRRENREEIIEYKFKSADLVKISVYIIYFFNLETLKKEAEHYLNDLKWPKGIRRCDVKIKEIKELK